MAFRAQLATWVDEAGVSHADLMRRTNKSRGYFGKVLKGELPVPDKPTCDALGDLFVERGVLRDAGVVWELAAKERLAALDPELAAWVETSRKGIDLSPQEFSLIMKLRDLQGSYATTWNPAGSRLVLDPVQSVITLASEEVDGRSSIPDLFDVFYALSRLPPPELQRKLRSFLALLAGEQLIWGVRARGGDVLREAALAAFERPLPLDDDPGAA